MRGETMGKSVADLDTELAEVAARGKEVVDKIGDEGPTDEQLEQLKETNSKIEELEAARTKAEENEGLVSSIRSAGSEVEARQKERSKPIVPELYGEKRSADVERTPGQSFTDSEEYQTWMKQFPQGGPRGGGMIQSDAVKITNARSVMGLRTATERMTQRALVTSADASAGKLVRPDYRGLLEPGLERPLTIRDLVTVIPVQTDAVEYAKELTRTEAAAPVASATALTGTSGLKPEAGLTFDIVSETVKTIAVWIAATKRILADATGLRSYIDAFLTYDVAKELEDQMIAGDGTGENFLGILNANPAIGDVGAVPSGDSVLYSIREAKRKVQVDGRTNPTAVVLNPTDSEKIDLLEVNGETNHFVGRGPFAEPQYPSIWGMLRVESEAITAGTFLVGDFRRAILFDREDTNISVGTAGDDFIRNLLRVLAEMRAAFGVIRSAAFCRGDVP
jgi:HK97 family phage major capsid protein